MNAAVRLVLSEFLKLSSADREAFLQLALEDQPSAEENAELNRRLELVRSGQSSLKTWDEASAEATVFAQLKAAASTAR